MRASSPGVRPEKKLGRSSTPTLETALFEDAFENAPQPMAVLSSGGNIVRANRSLCQMLGFTRGELQALSCVHVTHPEDFPTESEQRRRLSAADIGGYELVLRYVPKIGDAIWVRVAVAATRHGAGGETYLIASFEPAQAAHVCTPAKGDWRRSQFGEAALAAVHEIGNSLTPLMLNVEMILEHAKKRELRESAHQIFKAARRIAFTLRRLRGIEDGPLVAYVGESRMLDLRLIEPRTSLGDDATETGIPA
jgi:PAS domain S-box-containing protein